MILKIFWPFLVSSPLYTYYLSPPPAAWSLYPFLDTFSLSTHSALLSLPFPQQLMSCVSFFQTQVGFVSWADLFLLLFSRPFSPPIYLHFGPIVYKEWKAFLDGLRGSCLTIFSLYFLYPFLPSLDPFYSYSKLTITLVTNLLPVK